MYKFNLQPMRKRAKITQIELAKKMGVHQPTIANWELEKITPAADNLPYLAEYLDCKIDDLFTKI